MNHPGEGAAEFWCLGQEPFLGLPLGMDMKSNPKVGMNQAGMLAPKPQFD